MARTRTRRNKRRQRGGAWGYDSVAAVTTGGVPLESRTAYDHCYGDMRTAPAVTPAGPMQAGGACNSCGFQQMGGRQVGGGSATGGYGFALNNTLGKVYADLPKGACMTQSGGGAADEYGLVSYPAGYGFDKAHAVVTPSAMYLDKVPYDRTCQGGGRRRRTGRKSHKGGRKSLKGGRKSCKKTSRRA
jgi:hypothetical protein